MAKLARLPANDRAPDAAATDLGGVPHPRVRYYAFLSYSHKDEDLASWLHNELEEFRVPTALAGKLTANGVIPKRLTPVFRDQHELAAADDLGEEIEEALAASQFLIVLCSPDAAKSRWTNAEIETFKRTRPDGCVLAAIASGEPFASDMPGRKAEECFPPALKEKYDRRGRPTGKRAEPLAADLREEGDGRRLGFLKLVAGMLGVGLDDLVQRETTRRHRRLAWLTAASLAGMAVTSTLAITAIQARDSARDQRREAEGLVAFMLGDLKDKLEPIGRLDALDGVGSRVLAYYSKQDTSDLSDAALLQRSRALSLTAEVADLRGDLETAQRLYREAMAGTAEAIRRNPDDPQRLFDHAQNVFWMGEIDRQRGDSRGAEAAAREYKRLAQQMVSLGPDNMKWRMEEQNADAELGIILYDQRRFPEAGAQFEQALRTIDALATASPSNSDYKKSLADSLAWLGQARMSEGALDQATALRERHVALLNGLLSRSGDVEYRQKLIQAERALGNLYAMRGKLDLALNHLKSAVANADELIRIEPGNSKWVEFAASARMDLASNLLKANESAQALDQANAACSAAHSLVSRDPHVATWRAALRDCQMLRARLALTTSNAQEALGYAEEAFNGARSVKSSDRAADAFATAKALRLVGDSQSKLHNEAAARAAWSAALESIPAGVDERPTELLEHALILERLGRLAEARPLASRLASIGFQRTN